MSSRARRLISLLVLLASLGLIVGYFLADGEDFRLLRSVEAQDVALLVALQGLYFLLHSRRFQVILEHSAGRQVGYRAAFRLFVLGRFLNSFVPQAGNLWRAWELKTRTGITYTVYLGAFLAMIWIGTLFNLSLAATALALLRPELRLGPLPAAAAIALAVLVLGGAPLILSRLLRRPGAGAADRVAVLRERAVSILRITVSGARHPAYVAQVLGLGLGGLAISLATFRVGFGALGVGTGWAELLVFYAILQISNYVVITPGNLGIRELVFAWLGAGLGIGAGEAILMSALARAAALAVLVALSLPMGGLLALRRARRFGD